MNLSQVFRITRRAYDTLTPRERAVFTGKIMESIKALHVVDRAKFDAFTVAEKNEFFRTGGKISL